jgi:hypothetical protein
MGLGLVWVLSRSSSAQAPESLPELRVERSATARDCPEAPSLAGEIPASIGHPAIRVGVAADAKGGVLEVDFDRKAPGYVATIRSLGPSPGLRTLSDSGPSCAGLANAVAVALVLLLDEPFQVQPPQAAQDGGPAVQPASRSLVAPGSPPSRSLRGALQFDGSALLSTGLVGALAPGVSVDFAWNPRPAFVLDLGALWFPSESLRLSPGIVHASLLALRVGACAVAIRGSASLSVCAAPWLGALEVSAEGFTVNDRAAPPWFGLSGGVVVRGPIRGALGWTGRAELVVPVHPARLSVLGRALRPDPARKLSCG